MTEADPHATWMSVAAAARALRITETAVRKRIRSGSLLARGARGTTEVLISTDTGSQLGSDLLLSRLGTGDAQQIQRLASDLAELRSRLADVQLDRDRWYRAAQEAHEEAREASAARDAVERELRMLLSRR